MKLGEIAQLLEVDLVGEADTEITGLAGIEAAGPGQLTFLSNPRYQRRLRTTQAAAVILSRDIEEVPIPSLRCGNPYLVFARALELFYQAPETIPGIHPTAAVADSAELGEGCSIGAHVVIGDGARIGQTAVLHPHVVIYPFAVIGDDFVAHSHAVVREYCQVGDRVVLQNSAIVGADGFGFAPRDDRSYHKIVQSGIARIEDDVELGACTCVDRASVGETVVERGTKLDNLVQIGHGARVGQDTVLAAQTGIAGSTRVGDRVVFAGQVGAAGHINIGDEVLATAQTGIARSVEPGKKISGTPEMDSALWKKNYLLLHRLPDLVRRLRVLERKLQEIEDRTASETGS